MTNVTLHIPAHSTTLPRTLIFLTRDMDDILCTVYVHKQHRLRDLPNVCAEKLSFFLFKVFQVAELVQCILNV